MAKRRKRDKRGSKRDRRIEQRQRRIEKLLSGSEDGGRRKKMIMAGLVIASLLSAVVAGYVWLSISNDDPTDGGDDVVFYQEPDVPDTDVAAGTDPGDEGQTEPPADGDDTTPMQDQDAFVGKFKPSSSGLPKSGDYNYLDLGDVDNDGDLDIAACAGGWVGPTTFGIHLYLNDGNAGWTDSDEGLPADGTYGCVVLADLNQDGNLDLLAGHEKYANSASEGIVVYLGDGGGGWTEGSSPFTTNYVGQIVVKDINGDGYPDIAAATQMDGVRVWFGDGKMSWVQRSEGLPSTDEFTGLALGDIDGDGKPDIAVATYNMGGSGRSVHAFRNKGDGTWEDKSEDIRSKTHRAGMGVILVDFNDDSILDMIYNSVNSGVQTFLGDGDFGWTEITEGVPSSGSFIQSDRKDLDSSGNVEFVSGSSGGGLFLFSWMGGGWKQITDCGLPSEGVMYAPAFGDLDDDGDYDLACSTIDNGIKVWVDT